jgi:hypothetical protein
VKQKHQVGVLLLLVVIAVFVWLWNFRKPVVTADAGQSIKEDPIITVDNPQIRMDEIARARKTEYKSSGRNPFSPGPASQQHVAVAPKAHEIVGPMDQPPKPVLPLTLGNVKFYGFGTVPNSAARRAFLTDGENIYVVAEGEVLLNRFRILRIGNASLEFEEISTGRTGTAPLEEQAAGPGQ